MDEGDSGKTLAKHSVYIKEKSTRTQVQGTRGADRHEDNKIHHLLGMGSST